MRKFAVYAFSAIAEAIWSAIGIYLLGQYRTEPLVFFEVIIVWLTTSVLIVRWARSHTEDSAVYGKFQSKVDAWNELQRTMREEERDRRRYTGKG